MVWKRAKRDTREYYRKDRRGWLYNIGSALLVAIVTPIVSYFLGQIAKPRDFWLSLLAGVLAGLVVLVIWFAGVFISHLWHVPATTFREKQLLANRPTFRDIEIKEYFFDPRESFRFGLEIINRKISLPSINYDDINIFSVEPKVVSVGEEGGLWNDQGALKVLVDNIPFWNGGQLSPNKPTILPIVKFNQNNACIEYKKTFTFEEDLKTIEIKKNTKYKMEVRINGRLGVFGQPLQECRVTFDLFYGDERGIEISNFKREPEYEPY